MGNSFPAAGGGDWKWIAGVGSLPAPAIFFTGKANYLADTLD
jgi:hypothetical protein